MHILCLKKVKTFARFATECANDLFCPTSIVKAKAVTKVKELGTLGYDFG